LKLGTLGVLEGDTPGDLDGCEKKGFAGKGIRKVMKTKGTEFGEGCPTS
jgi:hypothetical protein